MELKKIGVVGAGAMGNGIAQVLAQVGYEVVMRDIEDQYVQRGLGAIDKFLSKSVEKGKLEASEREAILGRIKGTTDLSDLADCDFVVEAGEPWGFALDEPEDGGSRGGHGSTREMRVPLLISGAGVRPDATPQDARLVDVAPTVAALLDAPPPADAQGRALDELLYDRRHG